MEIHLQPIRSKLVNSILLGYILFIIPALILSLLRIISLGWHWIFILHTTLTFTSIIIYVFREKLSVYFKTHYLAAMFLAISFLGAYNFGLSGGYYYCILAPIFSTLILGRRTGYIYLALSMLGLGSIAYLHLTGSILLKIDYNQYNFELISWLNIVYTLFWMMFMFVFAISKYYDLLTQNMHKLIQKTEEQEITQIELKERDKQLKKQNEEYQALNKELTQLNKEYRLAKEKAEESEKYIRLVADNLVNGMIYQVVILNDNVRKFTYISDSVSKFFGCTAEEAMADSSLIYSRIHPEDIDRVKKEENEALAKMCVFKTELRSIDPYGNIRWVQVNSSPRLFNGLIYWDGIEIDLTLLKQAELEREKLLSEVIIARDEADKSKILLNGIMERVSDGFVAFDADFNYTFVNSKGAEFLGRKSEDLVGKNYWIEYPEARNTPFANAYVRAMETQEPIFFEDYYVHWDRWFVNRIYPSKEGITIFFTDITTLKKTEAEIIASKDKAEEIGRELLIKNEEYETINEELLETNEELYRAKQKAEESDKLKTAFLLNMSHEVRTPMNAINGFSKMLNNPALSEEKRKYFTSIIISSSNQLQSIVDDILTISSLETRQELIKPELVQVNSIVGDLYALYNIQAENRQISFITKKQLTDEQSFIYTDKIKLVKILSNLIENAIKFTNQGFVEFGYTIVETQNIASRTQIQFYVKDTGIGINPEMHNQIFERFVQVESGMARQYGGAGLGLTISKGYAELLDGKIWVESIPEIGSTFYFSIPYKPNNKTNTISNSIKNTPIKTILIAEDEMNNFLFIKELLADSDFNLIHAKNGKETVEICESNPNIDLVLMDIKMPIMDGNKAAKIIKEFRADLIIIAQSAYTLNQYREKYGEDVFDDYISKPINGNDLEHMIKKFNEVN